MGFKEWVTRPSPARLRRQAWVVRHRVLSAVGFGIVFGLWMWLLWGWWTANGLVYWLAVGIFGAGPLMVWIVRRSNRRAIAQGD